MNPAFKTSFLLQLLKMTVLKQKKRGQN